MSIITEPLPGYVEIGGERYAVNTDFKVWLRYSAMMHSDIPIREKYSRIFHECYVDKLPPDASAAARALAEFYTGVSCVGGTSGRKGRTERYFDFETDAEYIYAAFMSEYGINLQTAHLHWREFIALFSSLDEDCRFSKIISFRAANPEKIKNEEQKKYIRKMQRIYRLPDLRAQEERDAEFAEAFWNM